MSLSSSASLQLRAHVHVCIRDACLSDSVNAHLCSLAAMLFNGHYYQIGPAKATFANALTQASQMSYNGQLGYLAAVSSLDEYNFIDKVLDVHNVWLAATDIQQEGTWLIAAGPNISAPAPTDLWGFGEPFGGIDKNCAFSVTGGLSTANCSETFFYVIEYECQTVASAQCECMLMHKVRDISCCSFCRS
jgi:hypothetical protein